MKRIKLLFIFVLFIVLPITVKGITIDELPETIGTSEGVEFTNDGTGYYAYTPYEKDTLHLDVKLPEYLKVEGNTSFILNNGVTIFNIKITQTFEAEEGGEDYVESLIVPFTVTRQNTDPVNRLLEDLQVVGYDIVYDKKNDTYKAYVPSNIKNAYVYVKTNGNATLVRGGGLVSLDEKSTSVKVMLVNPSYSDETYNITIIKKNYTLRTILIVSFIALVIIIFILVLFKRYRDKVAIANPNSLNKGLGDINVDSIIKDAKSKEMNNISNENLENGVLTPRPLINEEKSK